MTTRSLSYLIETELEKAEVLLAAKAISNKLQQMAEQLAKMDASDVMPLGDAMREIFGADQASAFEQHVSETLRGLTEQVRSAKNSIADQLDALEKGTVNNALADEDSHADLFAKDGEEGGEGEQQGGEGDGSDMFGDQGGENAADDDLDMGNLFGGDPEEANSAGRAQKESFTSAKKVLENASADVRLTREFAGLLREGKSLKSALNMIAESYAIDVKTVANIVTAVKKAKG
jgi:hypothetical protein